MIEPDVEAGRLTRRRDGLALAGRPLGPEAETAPSEAAPMPPARGRRLGRALGAILALAALGGGAWYAGLVEIEGLPDRWPWATEEDAETLELYGNVDVRQVELSFKVEGRIAELAVDEGDNVARGQAIASLERAYFEDDLRLARARRDAQAATLRRLENGSRPEEIARARASVAEQEAAVAQARVDFGRDRDLLRRNALSREEFEITSTALRGAEARLEAARQDLRLAELGPRAEDVAAARAQLAAEEAAVDQAERRLEDSTLEASGDGVILTRAREVGAIVRPGETVFTLTLSTPVWVRTYLPEPELGRVHPGMLAEIVTDSAPHRPYLGHVGYISPKAEFTPKAVETPELRTQLVYRMRVVVDDPDGGLRQGMPVTVRIRRDPGSPGDGR